MATGKFVHEGNAVDYVPGSDTPSGTIIADGALFGLMGDDTAAGRTGAVQIEGVFELPKDGAAYSVGDKVDFDGSTIIASVGSPVGIVVKAAAAGDTIAWVKATPGS